MEQVIKLNLKSNSSTYIKFFGFLTLLCGISVLLFWIGMNSLFEKERGRNPGGDRFIYEYSDTLKELHLKTGADYEILVQTMNNHHFMPPEIRFNIIKDSKAIVQKTEIVQLDQGHWLVPVKDLPNNVGPPKIFFFLSLGLMFFIFLFVFSCSSFVLIYFGLKQANEASQVISSLKGGNLQARISDLKIKPLSSLILEFNKMADEIENLVTLLRNTDENRRKMLQELAHDLRTPLASMKSLLETLITNNEIIKSEDRKKLTGIALSEVEYFHRLVDDLLFLSGVHDLRFRGSFDKINLNDLIQKQLMFFSETNSRLLFDFKQSSEVEIIGNKLLIERLLKNALSNSCAYAQKKVEIDLSLKDKEINLLIEDDGPGLASDELKTFGQKKFSRKIVNTKTEGHISIGLGSVIMKHICDLHDVKMVMDNRLATNGVATGASLLFVFFR